MGGGCGGGGLGWGSHFVGRGSESEGGGDRTGTEGCGECHALCVQAPGRGGVRLRAPAVLT